jgi:hypothetical protein
MRRWIESTGINALQRWQPWLIAHRGFPSADYPLPSVQLVTKAVTKRASACYQMPLRGMNGSRNFKNVLSDT